MLFINRSPKHEERRKAMETYLPSVWPLVPAVLVRNTKNAERQWRLSRNTGNSNTLRVRSETRFQNAASLQCYAGTAPISFQSGQIHRVKIRRACAKVLRYSVHLWADRSRLKCAWANTYYKLHREKGKSHASALRCLGQRWLKILWKILETSTPYSEAIHMKNQTEHGSWVLSIKPQ